MKMYLRTTAAAAVAATAMLGVVTAYAAPTAAAATDPFAITRANLANAATFSVTQTLTPKGGKPFARTYKIAVKGDRARADFDDPQTGAVRFVANEKGIFSYLPDSKTAVKQNIKGGVEQALQLVFAQVRTQLRGAKKTGTATVAGQPVTVYQAANGSSTVYWGTKPGFRLPVKVVQTNEGGTTMIAVTDIRLNPSLPDAQFALPAGTRIMDDSGGTSGAAGLPSLPSSGK